MQSQSVSQRVSKRQIEPTTVAAGQREERREREKEILCVLGRGGGGGLCNVCLKKYA